MMRILILLLSVKLSAAFFPEVTSYAKVSRNGQEQHEARSGPIWTNRGFPEGNETEGRSIKNIAITMSPVYIPPRTPHLQNGEAIDFPTTRRYSTLDHDLIAKLDAKKQIHDRYHPHTLTFNSKPQTNGNNQQNDMKPAMRPNIPPSSDTYDFPRPPYAPEYKPPDYADDKPMPKPSMMDEYQNSPMDEKRPDSYRPAVDAYYTSHDHDSDFPDYPPNGAYDMDHPPKQIEYTGHLDHPPIADSPYDHKYPPEVIYDHIPDYHDHHHGHYHVEHTTEMPEMNDQRLDKRPYSYYFIGKKLWYIPLYFSIYFIIYIAALVLKSIARHKITLPSHIAEAVNHSRQNADSSWWDYTGRILEGIEDFAEKFGKVS